MDYQNVGAPRTMKTSPYAIASLVFSLVCCCMGVNGPLAILLGVVALLQIRKRPDEYTGRGLAFAGIGLGALSIVFLIVFTGGMVARYQQVTPTAEEVTIQLQEGRVDEAGAHFARATRDNPEFAQNLRGLSDLVASAGPLVELRTGYSIQINNGVTHVTYNATFESTEATIRCSFVEEDGEWRLLDYHIRST